MSCIELYPSPFRLQLSKVGQREAGHATDTAWIFARPLISGCPSYSGVAQPIQGYFLQSSRNDHTQAQGGPGRKVARPLNDKAIIQRNVGTPPFQWLL